MGLKECLATAVAGKEIDQKQADELQARFDGYRRARGGGKAADAEARKLLADELASNAARKKRLAYLSARNMAEVDANLAGYRNAHGQKDIGGAAIRMLEHFGDAKYSSVVGKQKALLGIAHAKMEGLLFAFKRNKLLGDNLNLPGISVGGRQIVEPRQLSFRKGQAQLGAVVKEAFGEDGGDTAAKQLFRAWDNTSEWLRKRFNAAGGEIPKMEGGWLPQNHDRRALLAAGKDTWKSYIEPLLDWDKMRHPVSGDAILPEEHQAVLDATYDAIVTQGWATREAKAAAMGRGALANQFGEARFLQFKDATGWGRYQHDFGEGDVFTAMMGHLNAMTRDIATLEVLGPNPNATVEYLKQRVKKAAAGSGQKLEDKARGSIEQLDNVFASIRGDLETPVNSRWADILSGARNYISSSVLGGAAPSSITDLGTGVMARRYNGIPALGIIPDVIKQLGEHGEQNAVRAGLILDAAQHTFHKQARYVGSLGGPQWTQWLADRNLTLSGLSPYTQAGKHAYGLSVMAEAADQAAKKFDELDPRFAQMFARWGIDANGWDKIRKGAALYEPQRGATFLRPSDIADRPLAEKYLEMILQETEFAVPSFSHRGKAAWGASKRGTIQGEAWRSASMFKTYGVTLAVLQATRIGLEFAGAGGGNAGRAAGAAYAAKLLLATTAFGALALQLKALIAGRDPRNMQSGEFWGAAVLQGGGLGLFGDFLFNDLNRYGGGLPTTLSGPLVDHAWNAWQLTGGSLLDLYHGKDPQYGKKLVSFAQSNVPGSTIWYLRLAYQREVLDLIQRLSDPAADKAFKSQAAYWQKSGGQSFWWRPGESAPQRPPNMAAALGSS